MSDLFFRNPRLTALAIGLVLVAGLSALNALPRQEDPTLSRRFGTVTTRYPGADALRVESLVTEKIEARLLELHEIDELDSVSRTGVSVVQIQLADRYDERTVDEVWSRVRDKLADARADLPRGALAPEFEDRTSTAVTLLVAFTWASDGPPLRGLLTRLAEELESRLRNVAHTRETELFGEAEEEIRVTVEPGALAGVDLTVEDVSRAIAQADAKVPAGQVRHGESELLIEVEGELDSLARVRAIPLARERDEASFLRVGDIARVERTVREPAATEAIVDGRPAVVVAATMNPGHRVDLWAARTREVVEGFRAEVPQGIAYEVVFDQSAYTGARISDLVGNLLLGAAIVVGVLVFLMGVRSALIVASALPLTVAMVLAQMQWLGVPLHQMSITGLIIALGLLIDNAIVVVDEFNLFRQRGESPGRAVQLTVERLFVPLFASTLTTVLAFAPIALMPGGAGEFVGTIAIGVGLAVSSSFVLSMTVIPALAGLIAERRARRHGPTAEASTPPAWWRNGFSHPGVARIYRVTLRHALQRPWIGIGVSLILPILGFAAGQTLSQQFFPANDRNQFQIQLVLPSQSSLAETRRHALRARELVEAHDEVVASYWFLGESPPRVFYNMFGNADGIAASAGAFVTTDSPAATQALLPILQRELMFALPDARVVALPFEQGPPFEAPIEARILGPDIEVLRELGEQVRSVLSESHAVTYTTAKLAGGSPKLSIATDEDEVRLVGLGLTDIAAQLDARLEGVTGGSIVEASEEVPVRVRVSDGDRESPAQIAAGHLLAPGRTGEADGRGVAGVPLTAVGELRLVPELSGITRRNGMRSNTVQAFLVPYSLIADSLGDFRARLDASGFSLPPGYAVEIGGEDEQRAEAVFNLLAFALPLFVVMAGAIVLSFGSFRLAGLIFVVAFLGIGLAQGGIWLFGYPLGFVGIVGAMGLVGLAINDAIVVLTALREDPRARDGDVEGAVDVVMEATRHVLATTFTTIGGFVPLIVAGGRFWPPMATAIAGGVLGCSIVALYLVPAAHVSLRRRARGEEPDPLADSPPVALETSPG